MTKKYLQLIISLNLFIVSFGQVTTFNPYVSQIPNVLKAPPINFNSSRNNDTQYEKGRKRIQNAIDNLYALEILNEGGIFYFKNRMTELINTLNKYSNADLSIKNNVDQLLGLFKPIYEDENILIDVKSAQIFRQWERLALLHLNKGTMEPLEYEYELSKAKQWLTSKVAGVDYTGFKYPNTTMEKDVDKKVNSLLKSFKLTDEKTKEIYYIIDGQKFEQKTPDDTTKIIFKIVDTYLNSDEKNLFYHLLEMRLKEKNENNN